MLPSDPAAAYQLRIRLDGISPLIWRRLLVTGAMTIAELHDAIQIAFGWSDSHLHQFVIHGKPSGIAYLGGVSFADNPDQVRLADFHFRTSERCWYEYNFHLPWRHEIRVEQMVSPAGPALPHLYWRRACRAAVGVRRPHAFLALRQQYPALCDRAPPRPH